jgi:Uma2 family endonuclease
MSRPTEPIKTGLSLEAFLEATAQSQDRCEFVDGRMFLMAGGTDRHNRLAFLLAMRLEVASQNKDCRVFLLDMFVRTPDERAYLPDVFVTCDESVDEPRVKHRPCFIAEVLSDSTEAIDRGEKFLSYRLIPELNTYVLLSQEVARAEVFTRQEDGAWRLDVLEGDAALVPVACLNARIPLRELYNAL